MKYHHLSRVGIVSRTLRIFKRPTVKRKKDNIFYAKILYV